jgi:hypothetical protein
MLFAENTTGDINAAKHPLIGLKNELKTVNGGAQGFE